MKTIGIAGTAKNTGKTTTTLALIKEGYRRQRKLAITSIGYDGEAIDNVTGLPKPRLPLEQGTYVAISRRCLNYSTADIKVLEETNIQSALGTIVIGEVVSSGLVVIAGPNKASELAMVKKILTKYRPKLLMVDGALSRIAPMAETDGLILATGAARNVNIQQLVTETLSIAEIFQLNFRALDIFSDGLGFAYQEEENWRTMPVAHGNLLTSEDGKAFARQLLEFVPERPVRGLISMPNLVTSKSIEMFLANVGPRLRGWIIYFRDPISLLLGDSPMETTAMLQQLRNMGLIPMVRKSIPLLAITVNPFYPEYDANSQLYRPQFLPRGILETKLRRHLRLPVTDVKQKGALSLWRKTIGF